MEIVDLIKKYKSRGSLKANLLGRGGAWLDTGSIDDFYKTSAFVSAIEKRQGFKIACIEEIAYRQGFISLSELEKLADSMKNVDYGKYLLQIVSEGKQWGK